MNRKRNGFRFGVALLLAFAMLLGSAQAAMAVTKDANNMPVTVEIPILYLVDGDASNIDSDTYTLTAKSDGAPMPAGSSGKTKTIQIGKEGKHSFGKITFTRPDVYEYTVTRSASYVSKVTKDKTKFHVKAIILNTGKTNLVIQKDGEKKKSELVYRDTVASPHKVKTGDAFDPIIMGMLMIASLVVILFLLSRKKREKYIKRSM